MIGPPPETVMIDGKEYFPGEPTKQHLRELRTTIARRDEELKDVRRRLGECEIRCAEAHEKLAK